MSDTTGIIITIIIGLMCLHGCAPVQQEAIERDYNAKIGKLQAELDELNKDLRFEEWRCSSLGDDLDSRILALEDYLKKRGRK